MTKSLKIKVKEYCSYNDPYLIKVVNKAVQKLIQRLSQYMSQGISIERVFNDDVIKHDIICKSLYVFKCTSNGLQIRLLYTVKDDTIILISYFIKNKLNSLDEQEWIGTFEKIGEKFLSSTVIEEEIISKEKEPVQ